MDKPVFRIVFFFLSFFAMMCLANEDYESVHTYIAAIMLWTGVNEAIRKMK